MAKDILHPFTLGMEIKATLAPTSAPAQVQKSSNLLDKFDPCLSTLLNQPHNLSIRAAHNTFPSALFHQINAHQRRRARAPVRIGYSAYSST